MAKWQPAGFCLGSNHPPPGWGARRPPTAPKQPEPPAAPEPSRQTASEDDNALASDAQESGTGHAWHHPNSVLFKTIKHGSIASDSSMRAFSNRLSDKEIVMIIYYFKSLWPDPIREKHSNLIQFKTFFKIF